LPGIKKTDISNSIEPFPRGLEGEKETSEQEARKIKF
jgi:hypothetical protein